MTTLNKMFSNRKSVKSKLDELDAKKVWNALNKGSHDTSYGEVDDAHMPGDHCKWDQWGRT